MIKAHRVRFFLLFWFLISGAGALTIRVDYRFDSSGFFNNPKARAAVEAAADRWSRVISQPLLPVDLPDDQVDRRIALPHPSTGNLVQMSAAAGPSSDIINELGGGQADVYLDGFSLPEDVWILFVGARELAGVQAGQGGVLIPGTSFPGVGSQRDGFLVRGVDWLDVPLDLDSNFPNSLTVPGGFVSVDSSASFHYDLQT